MHRLLIFLVLIAVLAPVPQAAMAGHRGHDRARDAMRSGQIRPLGEILATVSARYPGKVLDVDLQQGRGRLVYRIKVLRRDGSVLLVAVDARTRRILSVRGRR